MNESNMRTIINSSLFEGITPREMDVLFPSLSPRKADFDKNEFILRAGDSSSHSLGLLLSGAASIVKENFWGERTVLSALGPGDVFGETRALLPDAPPEASVQATAPSEVLFLDPLAEDAGKTVPTPPEVLALRERLARNLLSILARKNLLLSRQAEILSKRTIRDRLMTYLSGESFHRGLASFEIPFSRQELADHLFVDRCALSNEIGRLRDEGVIGCERRVFSMLRGDGNHEPGTV
ncbi:MAG: Crp/Fnr family transcriptional regulator [Synergistaceae bacterium]|nr:Crp/Fnr family transcriptional regulator [Synergistaceae bacterium]